jgi:hypothetical protein
MSEQSKQPSGVIGYFETPDHLVEAMKTVRDARYESFDAFTPYPVHGLDAAQGIKRSPIPFITFIAGLTGGCCGFLLEYWTSAVDWPINVGGKPFNSWPAFIPVTFELTILFAGLATAGAMIIFNGLPNHRRKAYDPGLTRDKFAIVIDSQPHNDKYKKFDQNEVSELLRRVGAKDVAPVYTEAWF